MTHECKDTIIKELKSVVEAVVIALILSLIALRVVNTNLKEINENIIGFRKIIFLLRN